MDDAYAGPGSPLMAPNPDGTRTVLQDGTAIYLRGDGSTPDGDRPFLDRLDLETTAKTRLHQSRPDSLDHVLGFAAPRSAGAPDGPAPGRGGGVLRHRSPSPAPDP